METNKKYLVRKISKSKWEHKDYLSSESIRADGITGGCLHTYGDILSLWECTDNEVDIKEIVLALALPNPKSEDKQPTLGKIDIVLISKDDLLEEGFNLEQNEGNTVVQSLSNRHFDAKHLDMNKICSLATKISHKVRENSSLAIRYSESQVRVIIKNAIESNKIKKEDLPERIREKIYPER